MKEHVKAIKNHDRDNVATLFGTVSAGSVVTVMEKNGKSYEVKVLNDIPYGHKIALTQIDPKVQVIKYGETIGMATALIEVGEHVHVHNIESTRGRGDWEH